MKWPDRRLLDLFGVDHPIIQAPMAGFTPPAMTVAVSEAGGLGSVAAAVATPESLRAELQIVRQATGRPFSVNFFTHLQLESDAARESRWRQRLAPYYREFGLAPDAGSGGPARGPFSAALCDLVLEFKPKVASFHFGLPDAALLNRLKAENIVVISSATTAEEARWLARSKRNIELIQRHVQPMPSCFDQRFLTCPAHVECTLTLVLWQ